VSRAAAPGAGATLLRRPGGRTVGYDDTGDPAGRPVLYLHGTPDSRLSRHPDDGLAAAAGVRLLAVDRPGYGATSPLPLPPAAGQRLPQAPTPAPDRSTVARATIPGDPGDPGGGDPADRPGVGRDTVQVGFAGDLVALLDALEVERAGLVAWSGGVLDGLAAVADPRLAGRLDAVHLVAGLVPREALDDPEVREAGVHRRGLLDMADELPADELAGAVAPLLAPWPCDRALALEHQREHRDPADQAALEAIPGAVERLADGLVEGVRHGLAGVEADVVAQVRHGAVDLGAVSTAAAAALHLWYGTDDTVTPPAFGLWYADRLPAATLHLVEGGGHYLPVTHWPDLLAALRS
jgi:pimeloyl-ACP methyl ester carboxylesterase